MKRSIIILMAASAIAAISCTKENKDLPVVEKEQVTMSFDATIGTPTKVELGESNGNGGYKVLWSKGDKIKVYSKNSYDGIEFTTNISSPSATASFEGTIEAADAYYAFYPSSVSAQWVDYKSFFSVNLPENQKPSGVSSVYAIAKADGSSLQFKHATGFVKFTIPDEYADKIAKVTFSGNDSEKLAGWLNLDPNNTANNNFNEGYTTYSEISLSPSTGGTFTAGTYYLMSFPATFDKGITMRFTDAEDFVATKTSSNTTEIKAGGILDVGTMSGLTFVTAYKHSLPWTEDFSSYNSANYQTIGDVTVTNEKYAGGTAPELSVATGASFSVRIDVKDKKRALTLTFNMPNVINKCPISVSEGQILQEQGRIGTKCYYTLHLTEDTELVTITLAPNTITTFFDDFELVEGMRLPQIMSFSPKEAQAMVGKSFTPPTLTGAQTTVTYTSSNTEVAEVNASTGAVTIKAAGKTTITADAAATAGYFAGTASYNIIVSEAISGYSFTFTEQLFNHSNSESGIWLVSPNGSELFWDYSAVPVNASNKVYCNFDTTKGLQFGDNTQKTALSSSSSSCTELTFSTTYNSEKIDKIVVNTSGGKGAAIWKETEAKISVYVNEVEYGTETTITSTPTDIEFNCPVGNPQKGKIVIKWTQPSENAQAIYWKSIQIHDYIIIN